MLTLSELADGYGTTATADYVARRVITERDQDAASQSSRQWEDARVAEIKRLRRQNAGRCNACGAKIGLVAICPVCHNPQNFDGCGGFRKGKK
jgi:hypothetical protein